MYIAYLLNRLMYSCILRTFSTCWCIHVYCVPSQHADVFTYIAYLLNRLMYSCMLRTFSTSWCIHVYCVPSQPANVLHTYCVPSQPADLLHAYCVPSQSANVLHTYCVFSQPADLLHVYYVPSQDVAKFLGSQCVVWMNCVDEVISIAVARFHWWTVQWCIISIFFRVKGCKRRRC